MRNGDFDTETGSKRSEKELLLLLNLSKKTRNEAFVTTTDDGSSINLRSCY